MYLSYTKKIKTSVISRKRMNPRTLFYFLMLFGILISAYLTYLNYFSDACPIGMECTNYPPILGLIWFAITPVMLKWRITRMAWQISGLIGVIVLVTMEIQNNYFCPFCTSAHISGLIMIFLSVKFSQEI